jgi:hypothetical protein
METVLRLLKQPCGSMPNGHHADVVPATVRSREQEGETAVMNEPQAPSPRRRMQELLAIPDSRRTEEEWDELIELEISLASVNQNVDPEKRNRPAGAAPGGGGESRPGGGGGGGGGGRGAKSRKPSSMRPQRRPPRAVGP